MSEKIKTKYEEPIDKFSLRDYLKRFDLTNSSLLKRKAEEIMENVNRIMEPYARGVVGKPLRDYYLPAVDLLEKAYKKEDFSRDFPNAIDFLIDSIDWE